jgi:hypothetical protein
VDTANAYWEKAANSTRGHSNHSSVDNLGAHTVTSLPQGGVQPAGLASEMLRRCNADRDTSSASATPPARPDLPVLSSAGAHPPVSIEKLRIER